MATLLMELDVAELKGSSLLTFVWKEISSLLTFVKKYLLMVIYIMPTKLFMLILHLEEWSSILCSFMYFNSESTNISTFAFRTKIEKNFLIILYG